MVALASQVTVDISKFQRQVLELRTDWSGTGAADTLRQLGKPFAPSTAKTLRFSAVKRNPRW